MGEPIVVDIGAALAALQASPELADMMRDVLRVPRWRPMDDEAKRGDHVFLARWNDCAWELAAAWWTGNEPYPWVGNCGVEIADGRFTHYMLATAPEVPE